MCTLKKQNSFPAKEKENPRKKNKIAESLILGHSKYFFLYFLERAFKH
jgi:hypothetical protein